MFVKTVNYELKKDINRLKYSTKKKKENGKI